MSKLNLVFKLVDSKFGHAIISKIDNEKLYELLFAICEKFIDDNEFILKIINLIHEVVKDEPIAEMLYDPEIRELLMQFTKGRYNKTEEEI